MLYITVCFGIPFLLFNLLDIWDKKASSQVDGPSLFPFFALMLLFIRFIQITTLFSVSVYIIRKRHSLFKGLFNNLLTPTLVFAVLLGIDVTTLIVFKGHIEAGYYEIFYSLSRNFIPIYIVAIINVVRLKFVKPKVKSSKSVSNKEMKEIVLISPENLSIRKIKIMQANTRH